MPSTESRSTSAATSTSQARASYGSFRQRGTTSARYEDPSTDTTWPGVTRRADAVPGGADGALSDQAEHPRRAPVSRSRHAPPRELPALTFSGVTIAPAPTE